MPTPVAPPASAPVAEPDVAATGNVRPRRLAAFLVVLAIVVGIVAAFGVVARGGEVTEPFTSVRGETYEVVTDGVYAYNAERYVAEGVGWDLVTLVLVVPALLLVAVAVARGSLRGRLAAVGLLGYLAYQYLMYAVSWAVGPLLLPFVVIYAASLVGIAWFVSTVPVRDLPRHVTDRFPRRGMMVVCVVISLALIGMWVPMVFEVLGGGFEGNLHGQTTLPVQALDLGIVVPFGLFTFALLWRRHPVGYLLATTLAVKGLAMATAICAMVLSAWQVEGDLEVGGLAFFAAAALACGWLTARMLTSIRETPIRETPTEATATR